MWKKTSVSLPWAPTSSGLKIENFHCPKFLDLLYTKLLNGGIKSSTKKTDRLKQSFSQDLCYHQWAIWNSQEHTVFHNIKLLTNNTELTNIACRLGHRIQYSLSEELSREVAYPKLEAVEKGSMCLPGECIMCRFTIEVSDNIDRLEETFSCTNKCNIDSHE